MFIPKGCNGFNDRFVNDILFNGVFPEVFDLTVLMTGFLMILNGVISFCSFFGRGDRGALMILEAG